ncbi:DUF559 domain-containing protein [Cryobacterium sp. TMT4-10]|nr:DUF559 domain-containing protein [Cryobacterium sp. TMT4-10]
MVTEQTCSAVDCDRPAKFKTRTKSTWCDEHLTAILAAGGLRPLGPFTAPKDFRLCECTVCGVKAHYRLEYTLEKNRLGEPTCRACYWRAWAGESRRMLRINLPKPEAVSIEDARQSSEAHNYTYLGALTAPSLPSDPHYVQCNQCGRLSAERLSDIAWGCSCRVNPRRSRQTTRSADPQADLVKGSNYAVEHWWDHDANPEAEWNTVTVRSTRQASFVCPGCQHRFKSRVRDMVAGPECPACGPAEAERTAKLRAAERARLAVTPVDAFPLLLAEWDDPADPHSVLIGADWEQRRFTCANGHHPRMRAETYLRRGGCPYCQKFDEVPDPAFDDSRSIRVTAPEMFSQWHPTRNDGIDPAKVGEDSKRLIWWRDLNCGAEWAERPADRNRRYRLRCPECQTILDSLGWVCPGLAAEWSPENPETAWHVRPSGQSDYVPTWICTNNSTHVWQATLVSRNAGSGCPDCREAGKSRVELDHCAAAKAVWSDVRSGETIRDERFTTNRQWTVDIAVTLADGSRLAIEYDGSYWHADRQDVDTKKSLDLLAAGWRVVRLREQPLSGLSISAAGYAEMVVYSTAIDPEGMLERVRRWVELSRS